MNDVVFQCLYSSCFNLCWIHPLACVSPVSEISLRIVGSDSTRYELGEVEGALRVFGWSADRMAMKSITTFLRRRGYALGEIKALLEELAPTAGHCAVELGGGAALAGIVNQLRETPRLQDAQGEESGGNGGHTLKIPLTAAKGGSGSCLCFTRVGEDRWVYYVDTPAQAALAGSSPR